MWWTIFTIVDLYIGIIMIDAMAPSLPPEKMARLRLVRKVVLALIAASLIALALQVARRFGWLHW